jgi:hypothetical protein
MSPIQNVIGLCFWIWLFWRGTAEDKLYGRFSKSSAITFVLVMTILDGFRLYNSYNWECPKQFLEEERASKKTMVLSNMNAMILNKFLWYIDYFSMLQSKKEYKMFKNKVSNMSTDAAYYKLK